MREICARKGDFMTYCLAAFRSRNETLYLANMLGNNGFRVTIINTPKEAGIPCGISVKFDERILSIVRSYIMTKPFRAFVGIFKVVVNGERNTYQRIS